jgi:hypothetical protein
MGKYAGVDTFVSLLFLSFIVLTYVSIWAWDIRYFLTALLSLFLGYVFNGANNLKAKK